MSAPRPPRGARSHAPKRVLVIGLGFIGTHIASELAAEGLRVRALTRTTPASGAPHPDSLDVVVGDASNPLVLERALEDVDHVVFSAGGLLPAASEADPELDARLTLPPVLGVLDALGKRSRVGLTYLSSGGTVYGAAARVPTDETAPARPIGAYGVLRRACEERIEHALSRGLKARVLRCATVYGEHQCPDRGQGAVVTFLRRVERREPIAVYGDGSTQRDYVHAGDVARVAVALVGRTDGPAVINVGSGVGTSLKKLIGLVEAQVGRAAHVERRPARAFDVPRMVLDVTQMRALTRIEPTDLATGIARTHRWLSPQAGVGSTR